jgi:hypothetical protein
MNKSELIQKIMQKKEFSNLPLKDVKRAFEKFDKEHLTDEEKIKQTRAFLMEIFSGFTSRKLLSSRQREPEWILKKHLSTRERLPYYKKIYRRILKDLGKDINVIDLGAGVNGFSYTYFKEIGLNVNYVGIEVIGQLVESMNLYFKKEKLRAKALHLSLFDIDKIREIVKKTKKPRIVFLFKIVDSLEGTERNYSKKLILELSKYVDKFVVSFPTESMIKREKIWVKRTWMLRFIEENFKLLDDFQLGGERYLSFKKK